MKWTSGRPTEPGLYWWYDGKEVVPIEVLARNWGGSTELAVYYMGNSHDMYIEHLGRGWHMALVAPEPPK